jgi:polar amino acid transport system permease protein
MTEVRGEVGEMPASPRSNRRLQYEQAQRRRSTLIAAGSTLAIVLVLAVALPQTPGWATVRSSFFDRASMRDSLGPMAKAFWYDVQIFAWSAPCVLLFGLVIASARGTRAAALFPLRLFATLYTDIVRGVPLILWIYLIGFGIPGLFQSRTWGKPILWGSITLIVVYSAYVAEVYRAGIESVHESQRAGARSLGLSSAKTMRHVVLPQAIRRVVPPLMNDMVSLQKDVALVSILGPFEALRQAQTFKAKYANFTAYVVAAVLWLIISIPLTRLTDWLLARQRREMSGTAVR